MISSEDVRRVTFEKSMRGYRCEDVNDYLKQVADSMDSMAAENEDLRKKMLVLAQRIDQYRADEDTLRTTMINAQRLGENVIHEAKQKAAEIIRTAGIKAEDREQSSRDEVEMAKQEIVTLKNEASSFKRGLMEMYRKHINLINKMPEYTTATETAVSDTVAAASAGIPTMEAQPAVAPAPVAQPAAAPAYPAPQYAAPEAPAPAPAAQETPKVDTVEFAIAPHENEPEEEPRAQENDLPDLDIQPGAGLYDDEPRAAAPKAPRKPAAKKAGRKPKAAPPEEEELDSPAFDNFEGVDFDS